MKKIFMVLTTILFASLSLSGNGQEQSVGIEKTIIYRANLCIKISSFAKKVSSNNDAYKKHKSTIDFCDNPVLMDNPIPSIGQLNSAYEDLFSAYEKQQSRAVAEEFAKATEFEQPSTQKGIGLPSEAAIIIGLADFLIGRVKAEISMTFAADLSKWIKSDPKLSELLSKTSDTLANLDVLTFKSMLPTLRGAIIEDFDRLPETITHPIFESSYFTLARRQVLAQVARLLSGIRKGQDPIAALSNFSDLTAADINDNNTRINFITLGLLAREINYYQLQDFRNLLADPIGARLCLRFIENDLHVSPPGSIIKTDAAMFFLRIINMLENIQDIIERLNAARESSDNRGNYIAYMRAIMDILELSQKILPIDGLNDILAFMRKGVDIQEALIEKNYNRLIVIIIDIIKPVASEKGSEKILRVLAFAANLASAKTSEDVQKALEAAADPVGSFRAKRAKKGGCYFTINGYFGASILGIELLEGTSEAYLAKMTVPLGMEFGWSMGGGSVGIFASFLDIGNVAYYRIKTEGSSENENPSLRFDQIFAPGCFIIFGISNNYPISAGLGYQFLPKLREIASDVSRINVHRISLFIGIDLALFRF